MCNLMAWGKEFISEVLTLKRNNRNKKKEAKTESVGKREKAERLKRIFFFRFLYLILKYMNKNGIRIIFEGKEMAYRTAMDRMKQWDFKPFVSGSWIMIKNGSVRRQI